MTLAGGGVVCFILVSESKGAVFPYMEQDVMKMTIGKRRHSREPAAPASHTPRLQRNPDSHYPFFHQMLGVLEQGLDLAQRSCRHS